MERKIEISLAPMLDVTTAHFRRFVRLTSSDTVLFTEMLVSSTVVHISRDKLKEKLGVYDEGTVVQIGGSDPMQIASAIKILKELGYKNFNLNCGCPSSRVQKGCFGAILMLNKELVAEIINVAYAETGAIVSLKIRTGVDEHDDFDFLNDFIEYIKQNTPNRTFYIHARKCWLKGLSPKQNRHIPPLSHETVYLVKKCHPELNIILNGSICGSDLDKAHGLDGLMIGREAIRNILVFWEMDQLLGTRSMTECLCKDVSRRSGRVDEEDVQDSILSQVEMNEQKCNSYRCKTQRDRVVHDTVKRYFEYFDSSEQVRSIHIQPIINILAGMKGCKAYRKRLNELVMGKVKAREVYDRIMVLI